MNAAELNPEIDKQSDLFIPDLAAVILKSDGASADYPLFTVDRTTTKAKRTFGNDNWSVTIYPTEVGLPTIYDKDVLLVLIGKMMELRNTRRNSPEPLEPYITVSGYELAKQLQRSQGGSSYEKIVVSLDRLQHTSFHSKTVNNGTPIEGGVFHLIDNYDYVEKLNRDGKVAKGQTQFRIKLSDFIMDAINNDTPQIITYPRQYLRLKKPFDKRLYEIANKAVGQNSKRNKEVTFKLATLHARMYPTTHQLKKFRYAISQRTAAGPFTILNYVMKFDPDTDKVTFGHAHASHEKPKPKPKFDAKKIPPLTTETLNHAQRILIGRDVDAIHKAWLVDLDHKKEMPDDAQTAFLDYCREVIEI